MENVNLLTKKTLMTLLLEWIKFVRWCTSVYSYKSKLIQHLKKVNYLHFLNYFTDNLKKRIVDLMAFIEGVTCLKFIEHDRGNKKIKYLFMFI